jgi:hypothetical protein
MDTFLITKFLSYDTCCSRPCANVSQEQEQSICTTKFIVITGSQSCHLLLKSRRERNNQAHAMPTYATEEKMHKKANG